VVTYGVPDPSEGDIAEPSHHSYERQLCAGLAVSAESIMYMHETAPGEVVKDVYNHGFGDLTLSDKYYHGNIRD